MGTQQLFLIVVGVIIIGVMIVIGLLMFRDQAASSNRDSIANDVTHLSSNAQQYYRRPAMFGGGEGKFDGLTLAKLTSVPDNANGSYSLSPDPVTGNPASVQITGIGRETGHDGTNMVKVVVLVFPDSIYIDSQNCN